MAVTVSPKHFSINIISLEGNIANITVKPDFTIEKTKTMVMKHLYGNDKTKIPSKFRLIHSSKFKQLIDSNSINDEQINEHDTLMLVEVRPVPGKENLSDKALKGPNQAAILQATSDLPIINPPRFISPIECLADVNNEIRQILISLVKASAKSLMYSSESQEIYNVLKDKLQIKCNQINDENSIKELMGKGYSRKRILKALRLTKSDLTRAVDWLIEHQDDPEDDDDGDADGDGDDDDDELLAIERDNDKHVTGPSSSTGSKNKSFKETCTELFTGGSPKEGNLLSILDLLLQSYYRDKKINFKPNSKAKQLLLEMGFDEKSIVDALKITGNNLANACEWLLGDRGHSLQDLDEGLDPESPIYNAIMNNPHIQLNLTKSKMFLVYLSIIEFPTTINMWIHVPHVLDQILQIYQDKKHSNHVNQYAGHFVHVSPQQSSP
ncbi:kip1 ubiquitination-promoting complex subunit 2 isoform X3 [Nomia melanderi]|uniref:kip1 ubiquitination-promoting complex subunit 2 isoform X3 n=1 Tax=Nomia melanderi TaxID=2448451 RepID=UPI001304671E|nr:ubiquitin-associated domain-containing protein 1 isoform X3 [Nomia melanderi]